MTDDDRQKFAAIMLGLFELYGKRSSKALAGIYWRALQRYEFDDIEQAANAHTLDAEAGQYMPKPADFVRHIDGDPQSAALLAWTKVETALKRVGTWQSVVFDDPAIHATIRDMGGWVALGTASEKELTFRANEFVKRYRAYLRHPPQSPPRKLLGMFDMENLANEHDANEPILLGDKAAARVLLRGPHAGGLVRLKSASGV